MLNIVSSFQTLQEFKRSKYFRVNLGLVATVEKNGSRVYNDKDNFSKYYNSQYNTTIYGQGNVGNIKFYTDHYITDKTFAVYSDDLEEFLFELDIKTIREKGIDFYLGHILKSVEEQHEERVRNNAIKDKVINSVGNADNIFNNPGNVSYEDLKAYLEEKKKNRYL